ncbi:MAG: porin [Chitinophagales bacterium]
MRLKSPAFTYSILLCLSLSAVVKAYTPQDSVTGNAWKGTLEFSAYLEAYYQHDFTKPVNGQRPSFLYSHSQHNRINVNLSFLKFSYNARRFRANAAVMAGTYTEANLSAEPVYLRHIYEANIGFNVLRKKQLWLDAGIFPSHIGFESAVSKDCWTLTRSMMAENSPYEESGIKLTWISADNKITASALVLNGWQRLQWIKGNTLPSFGWQLVVKPTETLLINSSSFIGTNSSNAQRRIRFFHNLYIIYSASAKWGITASFDVGAEQKTKSSKAYSMWHTSALIVRYMPVSKLSLAARFEHYTDPSSVMINVESANGFSTLGYSLNIDYLPVSQVALRAETRLLHSLNGPVFTTSSSSATAFNPSVCLSVALAITHTPAIKQPKP